jgi:hypothetical protein
MDKDYTTDFDEKDRTTDTSTVTVYDETTEIIVNIGGNNNISAGTFFNHACNGSTGKGFSIVWVGYKSHYRMRHQ